MNGRGQEISVANPVKETISYQTHYAFERREDGEEEDMESVMEGLALEEEGDGVGAVLSQPAGSRDSGMDWQTKEQDLGLYVSALLELEWRPVVKTLPGSQLPTGLLRIPSLSRQLSTHAGAWEISRTFHPPSLTKSPACSISYGSKRTICNLHRS